MGRQYHFPLPYEISSFLLSMGLSHLKAEGTFHLLPRKLQFKLEDHASSGAPVLITEADCDSISDEAWKLLAQRLGLQ